MATPFKKYQSRFTAFFSLMFLLLQSCNSSEKFFETAQTYKDFRGFVPVDPTEYDEKVAIVIGDSIVERDIKLLNKDQMLGFLNNETVLLSIGQTKGESQISYLPVTTSTKGATYRITMDYMKSTTLPVLSASLDSIVGLKRVGVGLRIISTITALESGINIGDLLSIGLAAKVNKLTGNMMIEVIGIKSEAVTTLIPLPTEIDQSTIQSAMQSLATIKSKIYDPKTTLYPQVIAINDYYRSKARNAQNNPQTDNTVNLQFGKTAKFDKPLTSNTRICLLTGNRAMESVFPTYTKELNDLGYKIICGKYLDDNTRPSKQEVRYFFDSDAKQAEMIAKVLNTKLDTKDIKAEKRSSNDIYPGYIEIWFGK